MNYRKAKKICRPGALLTVEGTSNVFMSLGLIPGTRQVDSFNGFDIKAGVPVRRSDGKCRPATKKETDAYWRCMRTVCSRHPGNAGAELIAEERKRQIEKEGFTAEHDANHLCSELTDAAVMYAMRAYWKKRIDPMIIGTDEMPGIMWPFGIEFFKPSNEPWPDGRIKDLVKAGALIAAEIDRLLNIKKGGGK